MTKSRGSGGSLALLRLPNDFCPVLNLPVCRLFEFRVEVSMTERPVQAARFKLYS